MATSRPPQSSEPVHPTRQQLDELDALLQRMLDLPVNQLEDVPPPPEEEPATQEGGEPGIEAAAPTAVAPEFPAERVPPVSYTVVSTTDERPAPAGESAEPAAAPKEEDGGDWIPLKSSWRPSAQTWGPLAEKWQQARSADPAVSGPSGPAPAREAKTTEAPTEAPAAPVAEEAPAPPTEKPPVADPPSQREPHRSDSPRTPVAGDSGLSRDPVAGVSGLSRGPSAGASGLSRGPDAGVPGSPSPVAARPRRWRTGWMLGPLVGFNKGFYACLSPLGPPGRWLSGPAGRTLLGLAGLLCLGVALILFLVGGTAWTR